MSWQPRQDVTDPDLGTIGRSRVGRVKSKQVKAHEVLAGRER